MYKVRIFISIVQIFSPNPMFDHLLESSHRDDSNKWLNIGFGDKITQEVLLEGNFTHLFGAVRQADFVHMHEGS